MFSMSHLGVEVAPQIPTEFLPANHDLSSSSGAGDKMGIGIDIFTDQNRAFCHSNFPVR